MKAIKGQPQIPASFCAVQDTQSWLASYFGVAVQETTVLRQSGEHSGFSTSQVAGSFQIPAGSLLLLGVALLAG